MLKRGSFVLLCRDAPRRQTFARYCRRRNAEADEIEIQRLLLQFLPMLAEVFGVLHHEPAEKQRERAHWQIDIEDPPPGILIGNVTSHGWSDHGRQQCGNAKQSLGGALLLRGKAIQQNRLAGGLETAAGETLHYREEDQLAQTHRHAAQPRS